jgi:hypothetical protein
MNSATESGDLELVRKHATAKSVSDSSEAVQFIAKCFSNSG